VRIATNSVFILTFPTLNIKFIWFCIFNCFILYAVKLENIQVIKTSCKCNTFRFVKTLIHECIILYDTEVKFWGFKIAQWTANATVSCVFRCGANYVGELCEMINPCLTTACHNNGTCTVITLANSNFGTACVCQPGNCWPLVFWLLCFMHLEGRAYSCLFVRPYVCLYVHTFVYVEVLCIRIVTLACLVLDFSPFVHLLIVVKRPVRMNPWTHVRWNDCHVRP